MTRYRKRNNFQNTFKDYLVPIVGGALLLLILFSIFKGGDTSNTPVDGSNENRVPVDITFDTENTTAFISYPNGAKEEVSDSENLYKGETIIVKDGSLKLSVENSTSVALNKIAEFKYNEDGSFSLYSSDAWIALGEDTDISMKYANISASKGSTISLTQNEAGSTIYVLTGDVKVSNLGGVSTSLIQGQKINISRQYAASKDTDLSSEKGSIDSYFKGSDWFIDNKGYELLEKKDDISSLNSNGELDGDSGAFIKFDALSDEMSTNSSSLKISGEILSDNVGALSINNIVATINSGANTFIINSVPLSSSINDLVLKVYGPNKEILEKKVFTVYSSTPITNNITQSANITPVASTGGATFGVDATDFSFTAPSATGKFSTTGSEITIRGITTAVEVSRVEVNGFKLASFNGSTWRYHAFERFETLEEGTNQYKVDYYGENNSLVYTDYYTIVKKAAGITTVVSETPAEVETKTISNETSAQ